jgi:hypothetical protein
VEAALRAECPENQDNESFGHGRATHGTLVISE